MRHDLERFRSEIQVVASDVALTHIPWVARYAIGDVQGCFDSLMALVDRLQLSADDELWLVGDLVNRGPKSTEVLRWVRARGDRCRIVLGNHDIHLLSMAAGLRRPKKRDTAQSVLAAADADELIDWLRNRDLIFRTGDRLMVHAGLLPDWTYDDAAFWASAIAERLRRDDWQEFLRELFEVEGQLASGRNVTTRQLRAALDVMTTIRCVVRDGGGWRLDRSFDGPPENAPAGCSPWFAERAPGDETIVFGHWAALGYRATPGYLALDSGCVWGGALTAVRLEDGVVFSQPAID